MSEKKTTRPRKKQPAVVAVVTPNGITGSLQPTQRPLIAYLPVKSTDLVEHQGMAPIEYNPDVPTVPEPFDNAAETMSYLPENTLSNVSEAEASIEVVIPEQPQFVKTDTLIHNRNQLPCYYSEKIMVQFQDTNRLQKLPDKTDVHCYWDCQKFNTEPCVIPSNVQHGVWRVYGNFCSPNCAVAYLFSQRLDANEQWERYAKLNRLYHQCTQSQTQGIPAAPPREVLRIFGGSLDITEYRELLANPRIRVDVLTPPMVSIIQSMDTKPIDFHEAALKNVFIQNDGDRLQRSGVCGLRLRRSKPLREKENTLEFCMGLKA